MGSELFKSVVRATVPRTVRNWLRSPSKSTQWLWDASRFYVGSTETLQLQPNWTLICHPHAYRVAYQAQIIDPEQRKEFQNFVVHCSCTMFLFDIGAHFGIFSLAAAHFGGKAIAVDPSSTATRMIETQAAINRLTSQIQVLRAAVSESPGVMEMLSSGVFSHGYLKVVKKRSKSELTQVDAVS